MPTVIHPSKVIAATKFVANLLNEGFCAPCACRQVARTLSLNTYETALLRDVVTVITIEEELEVPPVLRTQPLHTVLRKV